MSTGRELDVQLHLLDRQVIDPDHRMLCKVDDLELELDAQGRPIIVAILVGPRALGPRLGGRLGRWVVAIAARLSNEAPPRIDFSRVVDIGSAVTVSADAHELGINRLDEWVDEYIISRIPGSDHAS